MIDFLNPTIDCYFCHRPFLDNAEDAMDMEPVIDLDSLYDDDSYELYCEHCKLYYDYSKGHKIPGYVSNICRRGTIHANFLIDKDVIIIRSNAYPQIEFEIIKGSKMDVDTFLSYERNLEKLSLL